MLEIHFLSGSIFLIIQAMDIEYELKQINKKLDKLMGNSNILRPVSEVASAMGLTRIWFKNHGQKYCREKRGKTWYYRVSQCAWHRDDSGVVSLVSCKLVAVDECFRSKFTI